MPLNLAALLFSPKAWAGLGVVLLLLFAGLQTARLSHAKSDLKSVRAEVVSLNGALAAQKAALKASEALRAAEYTDAKTAVSEAQGACVAQVAEARKSERVIRQIVTKEVAHDPQGCPVRDPVSADELRRALQPPP